MAVICFVQTGSTLTIPAEPSLVFEPFLDPETMRACAVTEIDAPRLVRAVRWLR